LTVNFQKFKIKSFLNHFQLYMQEKMLIHVMVKSNTTAK